MSLLRVFLLPQKKIRYQVWPDNGFCKVATNLGHYQARRFQLQDKEEQQGYKYPCCTDNDDAVVNHISHTVTQKAFPNVVLWLQSANISKLSSFFFATLSRSFAPTNAERKLRVPPRVLKEEAISSVPSLPGWSFQ
jgi:hypothetical protein